MEAAIVQFENAAIYQKNTLILKDLNFEIYEGEFVYLIGKTGSGKSSLLKTIYGDLWLQKGSVQIAGFSLANLNHKRLPYLRRSLGIVFQDFQLLPDRNIFENLRFFLRAMGWIQKDKIKYRSQEVLEQVGLVGTEKKMPFQLSGGEQQRVAIARALLNHPKLLLADEPTGNLDPEKSTEILNLFFEINKSQSTAVIMATHQLDLIERFPHRTLFCRNGIVEDFSEKNL